MKLTYPPKIILLVILLLLSQNCFSQFLCGNNTAPPSSLTALSSNNCFSTAEGNYDFDLDYDPSLGGDYLVLKYNVHVMQFSESDPQNFEEGIGAHETFLQNLLNRANEVFYNVILPEYEGSVNPLALAVEN